jgi:hypothetical protein
LIIPEDTKRPWLTAGEAARRADVTPECIGQWVRRYGVGHKVVGRLRIDPEALARLLAGEPIGRAS